MIPDQELILHQIQSVSASSNVRAHLLLACPAVAVRQPVVLPLAFLLRLNHSVLLKLNQAALGVPGLQAAQTQYTRFNVGPFESLGCTQITNKQNSRRTRRLGIGGTARTYSMCL